MGGEAFGKRVGGYLIYYVEVVDGLVVSNGDAVLTVRDERERDTELEVLVLGNEHQGLYAGFQGGNLGVKRGELLLELLIQQGQDLVHGDILAGQKVNLGLQGITDTLYVGLKRDVTGLLVALEDGELGVQHGHQVLQGGHFVVDGAEMGVHGTLPVLEALEEGVVHGSVQFGAREVVAHVTNGLQVGGSGLLEGIEVGLKLDDVFLAGLHAGLQGGDGLLVELLDGSFVGGDTGGQRLDGTADGGVKSLDARVDGGLKVALVGLHTRSQRLDGQGIGVDLAVLGFVNGLLVLDDLVNGCLESGNCLLEVFFAHLSGKGFGELGLSGIQAGKEVLVGLYERLQLGSHLCLVGVQRSFHGTDLLLQIGLVGVNLFLDALEVCLHVRGTGHGGQRCGKNCQQGILAYVFHTYEY